MNKLKKIINTNVKNLKVSFDKSNSTSLSDNEIKKIKMSKIYIEINDISETIEITVLLNWILKTFSNSEFHVTSVHNQNKIEAYFNTDNGTPLMNLCLLINAYILTWKEELEDNKKIKFKIILDHSNYLYLSKTDRNFWNNTAYDCNNYLILEEDKKNYSEILFQNNSFYFSNYYKDSIQEKYVENSRKFNNDFFATSLYAKVDDNFKW